MTQADRETMAKASKVIESLNDTVATLKAELAKRDVTIAELKQLREREIASRFD